MDLSGGLALFISSPGGDGLAAERIINVCRSYSGTGDYWAIVPGKAKSAATMVCLGASKIIMGPTSELGTVDPQFAIMKDGMLQRFSVYNILNSYRDLFGRAVKEKGNLQPYLQQLANYDSREIAEMEAAFDLSGDIAVKALTSGMMSDLTTEQVREKILNTLILPTETKVHARPIYPKEAAECGLSVDLQDVRGDLWRDVYELYVRTDNFVKTHVAKCVESMDYSFAAPVPAASVQGVEHG